MATTEDDIRSMLIRLDRRYQQLDEGTFLVSVGADQAPVAARLAGPVLVLQAGIGPAPEGQAEEAKVFRHLLELNATSLVHAAYALEGKDIVLTAALEIDNLDLNELEAALADIEMAISEHVPTLREMVQPKA